MTWKKTQVTMTINRNDEEIEVTVSGTFIPACRGARDGRFGPPIEPDEPAYFEIELASDKSGREIELTEDECAEACILLMEKGSH